MLTYKKIINGCQAMDKDEMLLFMKNEFNKRVARIKKAERYYSNPSTTDEDVERTCKEFLLIFDEVTRIGHEIEEYTGQKLSLEIIENGFVI
ncbi:hypothetical protein FDB42_12470 [Clostridium botulinum]|nr:hypothetical protein [Clostridium botulinum]NFO40894.1 hypothetical protein [Clostridium botulinum]